MNIKQIIEQDKLRYDLTNKDKTKILNIREGFIKIYDKETSIWNKHNLDDLDKLTFDFFIQILLDDWEVVE